MDKSTPPPTLTVKGRTSFAQIPKWILRSNGSLSGNAVHLFGVIMSYASNDDLSAFPGRETLAENMGKSPAAISRYIKELEQFGAMTVERRRNKRTGNFYANRYALIWNQPGISFATPPDTESAPITTPTKVTTHTVVSTSDSGESDATLHDHADAQSRARSGNPDAGMTQEQRLNARLRIEQMGQALSNGHTFYDDPVQELWEVFCTHIEEATETWDYHHELLDMLYNGKWTLSAKVADRYEAGKELNKMIHTARTTP